MINFLPVVVLHKKQAAGAWYALTLVEQMGNIGSEVHRAILAYHKKDTDRFEHALARALDLFDLTLSDEQWQGRRRELTRAREVFCSLFYDAEPYDTPERLDAYFTQFAIAARLKNGK